MAKATHNGTCQVCGRQHAVRTGGRLADHGYTVEHGYFNGTCSGAGHLPLEVDKSIAEDTIRSVNSHVADIQQYIANPDSIDTVMVRVREYGRTVIEWKTRDEFDCEVKFRRAHQGTLCAYEDEAYQLTKFVESLEERIKIRHGQPLIPRPQK